MFDKNQIVFTLTAKCRDCYKCLKHCPVKAIRMQDGQAYVDNARCIACGTCIRECPQHAKVYRRDVEKVKQLFAAGELVVASLAPSFAGLFKANETRRLISALRELGFKHVTETASLAYDVARYTDEYCRQHQSRAAICSACPAVVNLVEKYHKPLVPLLTPVASPMIAHARSLKGRYGQECKVVFIGPCIAKKQEAEREEYGGLVEAVLTFEELQLWLEGERINLSNLDESGFDDEPAGHARLFPLPGGLLKTGLIGSDLASANTLSASGIAEINEILNDLAVDAHEVLITELLFCSAGCLNGPGINSGENLITRRKRLFDYYHSGPALKEEKYIVINELTAAYSPRESAPVPCFSEAEINAILEKTGKLSPEQQLNCGACGYAGCREKAIAVLQGMAELEMCLPYMRRIAEQRANKVIETSPNAIIILNQYLNIITANNAFLKLFNCNSSVIGKKISHLLDQAPFEQLLSGSKQKVELTRFHDNIAKHIHEIYYSLEEEQQFIGIFVNITKAREEHTKLKNIKEQTIIQTQQLLDHQIEMAQKIAQFLGENSAVSEKIVRNILTLTGNQDEQQL